MRKLASQIALLEGRKSQVRIGNLREVLKCHAAIRATYLATKDDKCRSAVQGFAEYQVKMNERAEKLLNKGMNAQEILAKLVGRK